MFHLRLSVVILWSVAQDEPFTQDGDLPFRGIRRTAWELKSKMRDLQRRVKDGSLHVKLTVY